MRQIKFKGKRIDGVWVFGDYFDTRHSEFCNYMPTIIENGGANPSDFHLVDPDTVSQFTGLVDKNGKEMYEGDVLEERFIACDMQDTGLIDGEYCSGHYVETKRFVANMNLDYENDLITVGFFDGGCDKLLEEDELYNYPSGIYLIGNIHDNPELLNEKR